MDPKLLFVYGTLKPSLSSAFTRLTGQQLLGAGRATLPNHMLYDLGSFPGVVPNLGTDVVGEAIDLEGYTQAQLDTILRSLDRYEGCPTLYRREQATINLFDKTQAAAWVYIFNDAGAMSQYPKGTHINAETPTETPRYCWR